MKKGTLLISSLVLSTILVFGQNSRKVQTNQMNVSRNGSLLQNTPKSPDGYIRCLTTEMEQMRKSVNPNLETDAQFESWISQKIKELDNNSSSLKASRNIPVVVHVIHNGDAVGAAENISSAQVISQITAMNKDYSATNTDYSSVPAVFSGVKSSMDIQFCLAVTNPTGGATTGIDRVQLTAASYTDVTAEAIKASTQWDPTKYLNIWVLSFGNTGLLGYAQFPTGSGLSGLGGTSTANTDGVVIDYRSFGTTGAAAAPFNLGRTVTHEVGHWLGLRHISGDAACGDDFCTDTPLQKGGFSGGQNGLNWGCPSYPYAPAGECAGTTAEMTMNFLDYTDDACMYMFTAKQKLRMDAVLANSPRRASLLTSPVCSAAAITADFTGNPLVINAGQTVTFTSTSTSPATLNSWSWTFTGGTPASFNGLTPPAITYAAAGSYAVSLTVGDNAAGSNTKTKTAYITVNAAGTTTCDSTAAGWNWNTETYYTGAYWTQDLAVCPNATAGYIVGHNCYGDNGWAAKATFSGTNKQITGLIYLFDQSIGTGAGSLKVWNANGTAGAPNTVLFSYPITTGQFSANLHQLILVPVSPAVPITGNFYIGNDHAVSPIDGDTLTMAVADPGAAGNQLWAKENGTTWTDLSTYGVSYKGTVGAVICDASTGILSHNLQITEVKVLPNPTTGLVSVIMPTEVSNFTVAVYNMIGEQVISNVINSNYAKLDLNNQPNGVYFVKVTSNGNVTTKKIILSK